jgi:hypothetical protein
MTVGRRPSRLENWNSSSETPAGEGIGTPKRGPSIGPVSAIERKARVSARTDGRASRSTWRIRPAFRTLTNMSDVLALTDSGTPIGHCLKRETSRVHNRKNRGHHEHRVTHSTLLCLCQHKASYYCGHNETRPTWCMNYRIITDCCCSATPSMQVGQEHETIIASIQLLLLFSVRMCYQLEHGARHLQRERF